MVLYSKLIWSVRASVAVAPLLAGVGDVEDVIVAPVLLVKQAPKIGAACRSARRAQGAVGRAAALP